MYATMMMLFYAFTLLDSHCQTSPASLNTAPNQSVKDTIFGSDMSDDVVT